VRDNASKYLHVLGAIVAGALLAVGVRWLGSALTFSFAGDIFTRIEIATGWWLGGARQVIYAGLALIALFCGGFWAARVLSGNRRLFAGATVWLMATLLDAGLRWVAGAREHLLVVDWILSAGLIAAVAGAYATAFIVRRSTESGAPPARRLQWVVPVVAAMAAAVSAYAVNPPLWSPATRSAVASATIPIYPGGIVLRSRDTPVGKGVSYRVAAGHTGEEVRQYYLRELAAMGWQIAHVTPTMPPPSNVGSLSAVWRDPKGLLQFELLVTSARALPHAQESDQSLWVAAVFLPVKTVDDFAHKNAELPR